MNTLKVFWELQNDNDDITGVGSSGFVSDRGLEFIGLHEGFSPILYEDYLVAEFIQDLLNIKSHCSSFCLI